VDQDDRRTFAGLEPAELERLVGAAYTPLPHHLSQPESYPRPSLRYPVGLARRRPERSCQATRSSRSDAQSGVVRGRPAGLLPGEDLAVDVLLLEQQRAVPHLRPLECDRVLRARARIREHADRRGPRAAGADSARGHLPALPRVVVDPLGEGTPRPELEPDPGWSAPFWPTRKGPEIDPHLRGQREARQSFCEHAYRIGRGPTLRSQSAAGDASWSFDVGAAQPEGVRRRSGSVSGAARGDNAPPRAGPGCGGRIASGSAMLASMIAAMIRSGLV
jgi:hypothetical protein